MILPNLTSEDSDARNTAIRKISDALFPDQQGTDPIWTATPRNLFTGIVLYLLETEGNPVTLEQVLTETLSKDDVAAHFIKIINDRIDAGKPLPDACVKGLRSFALISSPNIQASIISIFTSRLENAINGATSSTRVSRAF